MQYQSHKDQRTIILPSGRAILLNRLSNAVMGICGTVDKVGCMEEVSHYRFYTIEADQRTTRKVRQK